MLPGDDTANANGFIDARVNKEGEFTKPLYAHPKAALRQESGEAHPISGIDWEWCEDCDHGIAGGEPCQSCGGSGRVLLADLLIATQKHVKELKAKIAAHPKAEADIDKPGRIPDLEATRLNAEHWSRGAHEADNRAEAVLCMEQARNAWCNAAYAMADQRDALASALSASGPASPASGAVPEDVLEAVTSAVESARRGELAGWELGVVERRIQAIPADPTLAAAPSSKPSPNSQATGEEGK